MKPLLSICCTTYNHEKYIKETLDGFLAQQTSFPIEIIVHDDASIDKTAEIIREYAAKDSRIVPILQTVNQYSQNIKPWANYVFPKVQGKYIALCEGDDYWTDPLKLQKQVDFLENNDDFELCFHNSKKYFQGKGEFEINTASSRMPSVTTVIDLVDYCFIATPTVVIRNNFKLPDWFDYSPVGDWPLFFIQVGDGKIKKLDDYMAVYRVHEKGMWTGKSEIEKMQTDHDTIKMLIENRVLPEQAHKKLKKKFNKLKKKLIKEHLKEFFNLKN
ncbi:glycosyltransferase family 2 protein [Xanthomarina sp. F2636L]|uniref:glycosyltransferase family 2 protein n=1 Tax=Xanthomarina sp. F2636L TaxID=2996018 RepID=UPI00225E0AAC|nr:glycosyltransferase [Xanthomarina sp. F2636L]MCX7549975.1 glycosyltransferase [Xanthomarina sp. F2636L]